MILKRKVLLVFALFLIQVFFISTARAAIAVSPADYNIDFKPNLKQTFNFNFFSDSPGGLKMTVDSDLSDYVSLSTDYLNLDNGHGSVQAIVRLPEQIDVPGIHRIIIYGEQDNPDKKGFQLKGKVGGVIRLMVPYPGKYAELSFSAQNAKAGENVPYTFKVTNLGKESIITNSYIEIYDSFGKKIDTMSLGANSLNPTDSIDLSGELNVSSYRPGTYKAVGVVDYGGQNEARVGSPFQLGELYVAVTNYTREFQRGKINRMEIQVESFWNDPITDLNADVEILNYSTKFKTPSVTLDGFGNAQLTGFFDSTPIVEDKFNAKITLNYGGKTSEKIVELRFKKEVDYTKYLIIIAIGVLIIIILILTVWIVKLERELHRKLTGGKNVKGKK